MAQYTQDDYDVKNLNTNQRIDYDFYLLNYNVNGAQQVNQGMTSLISASNPMNLVEMAKKPSQISSLLISILVLILIIVLIIFIIWQIIGYKMFKGGEFKKDLSTLGFPIALGFIIIIIIIGVFYTIINKEIMKGYQLLPKSIITQETKTQETKTS